ncbi:MAG TPA: type IV toxin-antitoxin system AbiEi family antitoxin domain-containing protein [Streptosporangiaceae bacterium]|nr:type IV toxin-antitoxin system AbiEi family antitoxin domain-containing protein [Streptosporangiaceae bacterium]
MTMDRVPDTGRLAGIITTAELAAAGFTKPKIDILVGRGALTRATRGVYARPQQVRQLTATDHGKFMLRVAAATAIAGGDAVGSHADAAAVHGLALLTRPKANSISVSRPLDAPRTKSSHRSLIQLRNSDLPAQDRVIRDGVPVTSVARTVVDLARTTSLREGIVIADSALHLKQTTKKELYAVIERSARWPGIAQARRAVDFADARSESPLESLARLVFADAGLPTPDLQAWVGGDVAGNLDGAGRPLGRADFYWPAHSTIAEADGAIKYADPTRAQHQLQRDDDLRQAGFHVVHFTWNQLHTNPAQIIQSIKAAFTQAAALRQATNQP